MKKVSLISMLVVLILCVAMVFTGCNGMSAKSVSKDPEKQIVESMQKTMAAIGLTTSDVLAKAMEKGEITIELGNDVKTTLYTNAEKKQYVDHLFIKDQDSGQKVDLDLYYKDKEIAIEAPAFFGEGAYGVNLNDFKKDLKDSILLEMMETDYDTFMDENEEAFDKLMELLDELGKTENKSLLELKTEIDKVMDQVQVTASDAEIEIDGTKIKVVDVTYAMTTEHIRDLTEVFFDWYDDQLKSFEEMDASDLIELESDVDIDDIRDELEDVLDEIDGTCNITFSINTENEYISKINVDMDGEVDEENITVDMTITLGADPSKTNKMSLVVNMTNPDGDEAEMSIVYEKVKDEGSKYEADITFETDGFGDDVEMEINVKYDRDTKDFRVTMEANDSELEINGAYEGTESKLTVEIETISVDGDEEEVGLKLVAEATDGKSMPDMPKYENLLKMSEEDFLELAEKIEDLSGGVEPEHPDKPNVEDPNYSKPVEGGEGTQIYSGNGITVTATKLLYTDEGAQIMLKIENTTSNEIRCTVDNVVVNGVSMYASVDGRVPANSISEECYIELWGDYLEMASITEIGSVSVPYAEIYETKDYNTLAEFSFALSTGANVSQPVGAFGQTVYDANGITIFAKGDMYDDYGEYMTTLLIINNTGKDILLDLDDVRVNGDDTDAWEYPIVYKDTIRYCQICFWEDELDIEMNEIKTITFDFAAEGLNSYNEICEAEDLVINIGG